MPYFSSDYYNYSLLINYDKYVFENFPENSEQVFGNFVETSQLLEDPQKNS